MGKQLTLTLRGEEHDTPLSCIVDSLTLSSAAHEGVETLRGSPLDKVCQGLFRCPLQVHRIGSVPLPQQQGIRTQSLFSLRRKTMDDDALAPVLSKKLVKGLALLILPQCHCLGLRYLPRLPPDAACLNEPVELPPFPMKDSSGMTCLSACLRLPRPKPRVCLFCCPVAQCLFKHWD